MLHSIGIWLNELIDCDRSQKCIRVITYLAKNWFSRFTGRTLKYERFKHPNFKTHICNLWANWKFVHHEKEHCVYICEQLPFYGSILCYIGESWIHKIPDGIASCQMFSNKFGRDGIFPEKHDESDLWGIFPVVCLCWPRPHIQESKPVLIFSLQWPSLQWGLRLMVHCRFMVYKMCIVSMSAPGRPSSELLTSDTAEPAALITHPLCSPRVTAAANGHTRAVKILSAPTTWNVVKTKLVTCLKTKFEWWNFRTFVFIEKVLANDHIISFTFGSKTSSHLNYGENFNHTICFISVIEYAFSRYKIFILSILFQFNQLQKTSNCDWST